MRRLLAVAAIVMVAIGCDSSNSEDGQTSSPLSSGTVGVDAANTLLARWPDLDATSCGSQCFSLDYSKVPATPNPKFWEYTNGVPLYALWLLYEKTHDMRYHDFVKTFVDRWIDADGNVSYARPFPVGNMPNDTRVQDVVQPSTLLFGLYAEHKDKRYLAAMTNIRQGFPTISLLAGTEKKYPPGAFWHKPNYQNQQWLDGVYMSEPFLVRYGAKYAEAVSAGDAAKCYETATAQIKYLAENTYDEATGLYYHGWISDGDGGNNWFISGGGLNPAGGKTPPVTGTKVSPVLWSRSIAWLFVGTIDALEYLPVSHPDRGVLLEVVRNIGKALQKYQDEETGLWYQVITVRNDALPAEGGYPDEGVPAQPNWLETSASALFTYGLAKSVRLGWLPSEYGAVAQAGWKGVQTKIDKAPDGQLNVHGTVVGMSLGGTYNAYVNADVRSDLDTGELPAPASCADKLAKGSPYHSAPLDCKYVYVRDNVPQGFAAVMLASSEMEF
jgi:unsaturated rhamnogalacturonyl hydrolase